MTEIFITIIATALLSSLITLSVGYFVFRKHYEKSLSNSIERFKKEVGDEIEIRVKKGVVEGVKSIPSRDMIKDTTMNLAKTGLDIFGDSLKMATRPRGSRRPMTPPLDADDD